MRVSEIFEKRAAFSFEVFPPKTDVGMEKLCGEGGVLDQLYTLHPDYISCTYGAGGTNVGKNLEVLDKIQKDGKCVPVTHFTCIGNTKEGIKEQLSNYLAHGINHMLALRGDLPFGWTGTGGDLHYATELVKFVRQEFGDKFTIAVAGSPEGHIACRSLEADIAFLKQKQDNGADYIMTQLCWDMDQFRYWLDAIRAAGIWLPVDVGIMPILDQAATINMALSRNGCVMPRKLCEIISKHARSSPSTGSSPTPSRRSPSTPTSPRRRPISRRPASSTPSTRSTSTVPAASTASTSMPSTSTTMWRALPRRAASSTSSNLIIPTRPVIRAGFFYGWKKLQGFARPAAQSPRLYG